MPDPAAVQVAGEPHDTAWRLEIPAGTDWGDHVVPPLVVLIRAGTLELAVVPVASHTRLLGQLMALRATTSPGTDCLDQSAPLLVVTTMLVAPPLPLLTAKQVDGLAQATA
jgi:hypothetical protein